MAFLPRLEMLVFFFGHVLPFFFGVILWKLKKQFCVFFLAFKKKQLKKCVFFRRVFVASVCLQKLFIFPIIF
jgi:hypothetical protein